MVEQVAVGPQDSESNTPCFGRRICPRSDNNRARGICKNCVPCVDQFVAIEIRRGRRLKTLLRNVRQAWPMGTDYNILIKIAIVSKRIGKVWGYRAVRTAIDSSPELRTGGELEAFMRNEVRRRFQACSLCGSEDMPLDPQPDDVESSQDEDLSAQTEDSMNEARA